MCKLGHLSDPLQTGGRDEKAPAAVLPARMLWGTINPQAKGMFRRLLFRVTRGVSVARFFPIEGGVTDPETGLEVNKEVI